MDRWVCPACDREFARPHQSHVCVPSCTLDETFAGRPSVQREICDVVITMLEPVHVDPVRVGVFLSSDRKFAELRPKSRWLSLDLLLPRTIHDPRITRHVKVSEERVAHIVRLTGIHDLDDVIRDWLVEAYEAARY